MADIKGFRALRYDLTKAGDPQSLVTPPYDVIDSKMQDELYNANPYNVIRLEWGKNLPSDNQQDNRYTRAAADFMAWQESGVLARDEAPAFYLYQQEFRLNGVNTLRTGFLATIKAEGYESGNVLPHEETLPKHKQDRYTLMEHTYANFSPILGLYAQKEQTIDKALKAQIANSKPELDFEFPQGVQNRLWKVDDPATVKQIEEEFGPLKVYIADGHHRYETTSLFAKNANERGEKGCDYLMISLINLFDPGLQILPTHRLLKSLDGLAEKELLAKISEAGFTVTRVTNGSKAGVLKVLLERMEQDGKDTPSFGLYIADNFYLLHLTNRGEACAKIRPEKSEAYRNLDVTILHSLILEDIFKIGGEKLAAEGYVGYTRQNQEAVEKVDSGEYACAFLLNSTHIQELLDVSESGEKMPQKSTYFYPKIIAGLTINKLGE